jgi:hypothetical protein
MLGEAKSTIDLVVACEAKLADLLPELRSWAMTYLARCGRAIRLSEFAEHAATLVELVSGWIAEPFVAE